MRCGAGEHESVHISVIATVCSSGSLFQSFLCAFHRGAGSVEGLNVITVLNVISDGVNKS